MKSKDNLYFTFILAALLLVVLFVYATWDRHDNAIRDWAKDNGYTVVSVERVSMFYNDSPFWRRKNDDLCRATLVDANENQKTSFFRWRSWWWMDQAWKE